MVKNLEIQDKQLKSEITNKILRQLPEWFGMEEGILNYVEGVKEKKFIVVKDEDKPIGFISLSEHNPYTAEIYVMGILKEYHRQGIGKTLINKAEQVLREKNYRFFMVKTLSDSSNDKNYRNTREFYIAVGFYPLEEIKELWDENNPCLIMVKNI